jgi:hypothetical protein
MTLLSLLSDCIDTGMKAVHQIWDIVQCVAIIIRSLVTAIEYAGIKQGMVVESGPFATTCRQLVFVGYQISDITSGLSDALEELDIRNKAMALNSIIDELGIDSDGKITSDAILRKWIHKSIQEVQTPVDAGHTHCQSIVDQMYTLFHKRHLPVTDPLSHQVEVSVPNVSNKPRFKTEWLDVDVTHNEKDLHK